MPRLYASISKIDHLFKSDPLNLRLYLCQRIHLNILLLLRRLKHVPHVGNDVNAPVRPCGTSLST